MKFFLDTANIDEIRAANKMVMVDGVTTNPSLITKEGRDFKEARVLAAIHANVVIKVPMTVDGLKAVRILAREGIRTKVTLIFSTLQALMAAKAGAAYVSPFVGRLDDLLRDWPSLVEQVLCIYQNYDYQAEIIVASVRHSLYVLEAALMGAHIATIPLAVLKRFEDHPMTEKGIAAFLADWKKANETT